MLGWAEAARTNVGNLLELSNGPALGSFLALVRRPAGKSVPAEQDNPVPLYQQRQREERQPSPVQVSAPPEKVDDEEDFVWKDDEDETLAAPRGHVQEIKHVAPSVSQLEDDDEADLVWRDDEEEPPQAAQPLVPPEAPDDEEVERVWRDDEASTPGRDEYEHDVFETDETKPETPEATMLEEMISETEQYVVEEDDDFEPEELPESSPESQGAVTPRRPSSKTRSSLRTRRPFHVHLHLSRGRPRMTGVATTWMTALRLAERLTMRTPL